ncbi:MAG: NAD(P)-dependent oxidoreductase [Acidimicrobiales bacterium]
MTADPGSTIAVWPRSGRWESLEAAVTDAGGRLAAPADAAGLIWADASRPDLLAELLAAHDHFEWVSLPFAGIDPYLELLDDRRIWTAAKGVYAEPVAEHALTLALAGMRGLPTYARAARWAAPEGVNLLDAAVTIYGAGGITRSLLRLLEPFRCRVTVVRRRNEPMTGVSQVVTLDDHHEALHGADLVVLALALTDETRHVIDEAALACFSPHTWLVNVARGGHVDTVALLSALDEGRLAGAALDVTDPEPLPEGHPLWRHSKVLITPHIANTPEMGVPLLARHTRANVVRWLDGRPLLGVVDVAAGY